MILSLNIRGLGLEDKKKTNWFRKLCHRENPKFIALQETKCSKSPEKWIKTIWGNNNSFNFAVKNVKGNSGGIITVWDSNYFTANHFIEHESFIAVKGVCKDAGACTDYMWNLFGDSNEVRFDTERKNTDFIESRAKMFNDFIKSTDLIDIPLGGRLYTRISDNGLMFSKIDRFLIFENCLQQWPNIFATILDKKHLDHCPIILKNVNTDFGPKPVKVFDEWLRHKDAHDILKKTWNEKLFSTLPEKSKRKFSGRTWFSIINIEHTLSKLGCDISNGFVKVIGKGRETNFWCDKWHGNIPLKDLFPRLHHLENNKNCTVAERVRWIFSAADVTSAFADDIIPAATDITAAHSGPKPTALFS
ncbi:uncharacterized protein [Rutidosis leptorrhynchoides]|uniref:uncharacterized protein n=1 Tax=Rutidosis leptorrhynchoides TaxID=125765 RepID=UPI003A99F459